MPASQKIQESLKRSSFIRQMFEEGNRRRAKYGAENVFDFSLGNPDLEPPSKLRQVLCDLANDPTPGTHGYMANAGYVKTRQAIADYLNKFNDPQLGAEDVVMTAGAGGGLNVVLKTILNLGEEVLIPRPFFVEYTSYVDNHQGVAKTVRTKPDFSLDLDAMAAEINPKTRAVLIDSPNNPTGKVYSASELHALADMLRDFSQRLGQPIYLISDEPYRKLVYDGVTVPSVLNVYDDSFVVTSFSKDLSLPGERIGYVAANPRMADRDGIEAGLVLCNRILGFVNAPALMQRAIPYLLNETVDIAVYQRRRDLLCDGLMACGFDFPKPQGAFYAFPPTPIPDDVAFVAELREENILPVPGSGFGGPGHIRIAYCVPETVIERALPGFARVMKKYRRA